MGLASPISSRRRNLEDDKVVEILKAIFSGRSTGLVGGTDVGPIFGSSSSRPTPGVVPMDRIMSFLALLRSLPRGPSTGPSSGMGIT